MRALHKMLPRSTNLNAGGRRSWWPLVHPGDDLMRIGAQTPHLAGKIRPNWKRQRFYNVKISSIARLANANKWLSYYQLPSGLIKWKLICSSSPKRYEHIKMFVLFYFWPGYTMPNWMCTSWVMVIGARHGWHFGRFFHTFRKVKGEQANDLEQPKCLHVVDK